MKANILPKLLCLLTWVSVTGCSLTEKEPVIFEFKMFNVNGVETTSFKANEDIIFYFAIKNNTGRTVKWKFLTDQKLSAGLLPALKRDELFFDVFQDSTYKFIGRPYTSLITTQTARPYEELAPHSSIELQLDWQGDQKKYKAFPNYGFVFAKNSNLSVGHYITGVAKAIEIDGITRQVYLVQNFSVN